MVSLPPLIGYYQLTSASVPFEPIYVSIPRPETASQDDRPEWLVLIPR